MPDNVVDLGQFDAPRPNPLGQGLAAGADNLAQGITASAKIGATATNNANRLRSALARAEKQKDDEDYKHTETTLNHLGIMAEDDPTGYARLMASDQGKELIKHVGKIMPDFINPDATNPIDKINLSGFGFKDQAQKMLEDQKKKILADPNSDPKIKAKMASLDTAKAARAVQNASKDTKWMGADASTKNQLVSQYMALENNANSSVQKQQPMQSNPTAAALAPQGSSSSNNDPLGILNANNN